MKYILKIGFGLILSISLSSPAASKPVRVPDLFDNGPATLLAIKIDSKEVASIALLEAVIETANSATAASSCESLQGNYPIEIFADGAINKPETNVVKVSSPENSETIALHATIEPSDSFFGQRINIRQTKNGKLKETLISEYSGLATVNSELTLFSLTSNANVSGQNGTLIPHQNLLIKHIYEESKLETTNQYIAGWGTAAASKSGFPNNLVWTRIKVLRTVDQLKRVVLQNDRLIGTSPCRITIDTAVETRDDDKTEKQKKLFMKGIMIITKPQTYDDNSVVFEF